MTLSRSSLFVIALIIFGAGFGVGRMFFREKEQSLSKAELIHKEAQVQHLLRIAYTADRDSFFPKTVPTGKVMKEVHQYKHAPEVVRSILCDEMYRIQEEDTPKIKGLENASKAMFLSYANKIKMLEEWKPGEIEFIKSN